MPLNARTVHAWGCGGALALVTRPAAAHAPGLASGLDAWATPASWAVYVLAWALYLIGSLRVHPAPAHRAAFHCAMLISGMALFGPIDAAAAHSTAMHMLQHMLLITVVAPLLVMARPLVQWRAATGPTLDVWTRPVLRSLRHPWGWAAAHGLALWIWHLPGPYMAALLSDALHALEHACFAFTAWGFWWAVLRAPTRARPAALMALWATLMHTGFLGAVLVFAPRPLYFAESRTLEDQQLAGLLMWAPGGLAYMLAAAWCARRWLTAATTEKAA